MELKEELIDYKLLLAERRIRAKNLPSWTVKKLKVEVMEAENWLTSEIDGFRKNNEEINEILSIRREALEEIYGTFHG